MGLWTRMHIRSLRALLVIFAALAIPSAAAHDGRITGSAGLAFAQGGASVARPTPIAAPVPRPIDVIGFTPGDDRKLASWSQIADYFRKLAASSDRVKLEDLGKTTLGRPFLLAIISSPDNLSRLDRFKEIQRRLADPRTINNDDEADKLIAEGRTIVLITCGIHSTEVGGNLVSIEIAYRLASDSSPETREILSNCIVLLVPSLNPDGVDIVKQWYDKTLGTPSEGTAPPELYHYYTGHDNNRDWYAFTQVETQMTVDKVHNPWHPQIVHDIHQQGETGSRFFLPPYLDPWEPNVPAKIQAGVNFMGSTMAWELTAQGKAGVVINGVYDAWTPARAYQHYHGGIRILSETASARLASPTSVPFDNLTRQINVDPKTRSWNFPLVWPGGEWKLSNIIDYMRAGAFALLRNAARYRDRWVRDFYLVGKDAVRPRAQGEPYAFLLVPPSQEIPAPQAEASADGEPWLRYGMARLTGILARGQAEVLRAKAAFMAGGRSYPTGTRIVLMRQPYGAYAKALLERQHYPDIREYPGGPPRRPYDVTAQTLPLLMGVKTVRVDSEFEVPITERITLSDAARELQAATRPATAVRRVAIYKSHSPAIDEGWTRWIFDQIKIKYSSLVDSELRAGGLKKKYDCIIIPDQSPRQIGEGLPKDRYPADISGGMGPAGIKSLKDFIDDGGTVITLNGASEFAIETLGVPVKNVLRGVASKDFYCPGSILEIEFEPGAALAQGVAGLEGGLPDGKAMAWFENGPALEPTGPDARVIARFGKASNVLLSGWLLGADRIGGQGAIVEATRGRGRVIMFAFAPQYRGQSWATLPFLLNAMRATSDK